MLIPTLARGQSASHNAATIYDVIELPLRPTAISDTEWVAGTTEDQHAARWSSTEGVYRVPLPAEFSFSESAAINSRGDVVGTGSAADYRRRAAFVLRGKKVSILAGKQSRANDINDLGEIVGQAILPGGKVSAPVLWKDGSLIDLQVCCAGSARIVNSQGLIAGDTYDKEGRYHAFLWDASHGARMLSVPGEQYSSVLALNARGQFLLKVTPGGLFIGSGGKRSHLEILKATPRAMDDNGMIVGSFGPNPEVQRAFVWDKEHGLRDLNTLIPAGSGWKLEVASSCNDKGEIVGWGDHQGQDNRGFLLRPRNRSRIHRTIGDRN